MKSRTITKTPYKENNFLVVMVCLDPPLNLPCKNRLKKHILHFPENTFIVYTKERRCRIVLIRNLGAILYVCCFLYVSYIWYSVPGIKLNTLSGDKLRCIKRSQPTTEKTVVLI